MSGSLHYPGPLKTNLPAPGSHPRGCPTTRSRRVPTAQAVPSCPRAETPIRFERLAASFGQIARTGHEVATKLVLHDAPFVEAEEPAVAELAEVIDQHVDDIVRSIRWAEGVTVLGEGQQTDIGVGEPGRAIVLHEWSY